MVTAAYNGAYNAPKSDRVRRCCRPCECVARHGERVHSWRCSWRRRWTLCGQGPCRSGRNRRLCCHPSLLCQESSAAEGCRPSPVAAGSPSVILLPAPRREQATTFSLQAYTGLAAEFSERWSAPFVEIRVSVTSGSLRLHFASFGGWVREWKSRCRQLRSAVGLCCLETDACEPHPIRAAEAIPCRRRPLHAPLQEATSERRGS